MKSLIVGLMVSALAVGGATAQESAAGQGYDAQVNWSALSNKIDMVNTQYKIMASLVEKMQTCNAARKIYAPADAGRDTNDCVSAGATTQTGRVTGTTGQRVTVTFAQAFDRVPTVTLAMQGLSHSGAGDACNPSFGVALPVPTVTKTGFSFIYPGNGGGAGGGHGGGCNSSATVNGVGWVAVDQ
jgi:hypothetical protein